MLFFDFEVFKEDWLVVVIDMIEKREHVIVNDRVKLVSLYEANTKNIWIGFNAKRYDKYILQSILCDFNPKEINDFIIVEGKPGWSYSRALNEFPVIIYDVMNNLDPGLKTLEGYMGNDIRESTVPFDLDRKLTEEEIQETIKYCRHDVEQTIEVFLHRQDSFKAHMGLVELAGNNLYLLERTHAQLSANILEASEYRGDDEFDLDFPDTLQLDKYGEVLDFYKNPDNHCYSRPVEGRKTREKVQLTLDVAGVPHVFGYGGIHGARDQYHGEGDFILVDVTSMYPSLMIEYNLHSRAIKDPQKFVDIYHTRLKYKAEKNPLQEPLKLVLNTTYGTMKDPNNRLYDPRQANRVCIYGQLLILDLIEKLEPYCEIIQSNTDGILIKLPNGSGDESFYKVDEICQEWEDRTRLHLEFEEFEEVYQKDVNNYIFIDSEGNYESKGAYVKKLNDLDNDLPIVNKALVNYMVDRVPIEETVNECNSLWDFQLIARASSKFKCLIKDDHKKLNEKTVRVFASSRDEDGGIEKVSKRTGKPNKIPNSPLKCFIDNGNVKEKRAPNYLDRDWYIDLAVKRLNDFGVNYEVL